MLNVSKLCSGYGAIQALRSLDLAVGRGEFVAIVGSNGAGKSTALNSIAGLHRPTSGSVLVDGKEAVGLKPHRMVRRGIAIVPEGRMVVAPLSVKDNLELGRFATRRRADFRRSLEAVYSLFPRLAERRSQYAGLLSGGEQQMLALGRAIVTSPKLLLLDEPSMGLAPSIVDDLFQAIGQIRQLDIAILLVEQNAALALSVADHVHVLERGRVVADGTPEALSASSKLMEAYFQ